MQPTVDAVRAIKWGPTVWHFNVEVKPSLNRTTLGLLKGQIRAGVGEWLLVTRYIAAGQADELQMMNIAFLDTAANAFINQEDLYVFIEGHVAKRDHGTRKGDIF